MLHPSHTAVPNSGGTPQDSLRHEVVEWRTGFEELVQGKPYDVRRDVGFRAGDLLIVREYDPSRRVLTGRLALFRLTWVSRASDHGGLYEGLLPRGTAVIGLQPAHVIVSDASKAGRAEPARASLLHVAERSRAPAPRQPYFPARSAAMPATRRA